jgi:hypothetical protein
MEKLRAVLVRIGLATDAEYVAPPLHLGEGEPFTHMEAES